MRGHDNNPHRRKTPHPNPLLQGEGAVPFSPREKVGMRGSKIHDTKSENRHSQQTPLTALPCPR